MNLQHLQEQVKRDVRVDEKNLNHSAAHIPMLHHKYLEMLTEVQLKCVKLKADHDKLYRAKYMYYRNDFNVVLKNKAEIDILIDGDDEVQKVRLKLEYEKSVAAYLESVIKQIGGLSFLVRDIVEWSKFQAGAY